MKRFQTSGFGRILLQFTTSYILFILLPVLVLNVAAGRAIRLTEENAMRSNLTVLRHSRSMIDQKLRAIDSAATQILMNTALCDLQYTPELKGTAGYYPLWQAANSFKSMGFLDDEISMGVYYRRSGIFLTPNSVSNSLARDYGELYRFGEYSYEQFRSQLQPEAFRRRFFPDMEVVINGQSQSGMLYTMPLSGRNGPQEGGTIYFILAKSMISELFSPVLEAGGGYLILDAQNRPLLSNGEIAQAASLEADLPMLEKEGLLDDRFYGKENIASYLLSDYGLKLITITPRREALRDVRGLRILSAALNIVAVCLAVGYAFYLAFKNSKRLTGLLENAADDGLAGYNGENIFDYLNNAMLQLASSNLSLRQSAEKQLPVLRAAFLDRLVNGSFASEEELLELAARLDFPVSGCRYCTLVILLEEESGGSRTVEELGQFAEKKQRALAGLERVFEGMGYIYSRTIDEIIILCTFSQEESPRFRAVVEERIREGIERIYHEAGLLLRCVGSGLYDKIGSTYESYGLCRNLFLRYSFIEAQGCVLWSEEERPATTGLFIYPPEFEGKLLRQIKSGDCAGALASVEEITRKNFNEQPLSPGMSQLFVEQLKITLLKAAGEAQGAEQAEKKLLALRGRTSGPALHAAVADIVQELCGSYARSSSEKAEGLRREVTAFMEGQFRDPNLSLKYAAEHFHLSEAYFSQLFKELAGENFSAYLDRLRMQHARQLLRTTPMKVDEIALESGYALASTFRRAYKALLWRQPHPGSHQVAAKTGKGGTVPQRVFLQRFPA